MTILIITLYVMSLAALVLVRGVHPVRSNLSRFELERRANKGQSEAVRVLRREHLLHDVYSLQHVVAALLLVIVSALGVLLFHWMPGFLISLLIALEVGAVARLKPLTKQANRLYDRYEVKVLDLIERHPRIFRLLRTVAPFQPEQYILQSHEELIEVVKSAESSAVSDQQKQLIINVLEFDSRLVGEIMTPRDQIDTVHKSEVLGPLVLDELHKTGHSRFPVIEKNVDNIVGILHVSRLLQLDQRRSMTADAAMDPQVNYIRVDQTLQQALSAHLRTRHHLFVVIDKDQKTVGVLSLEDVIEALLGREIRDEHEADNNPQAVANRSI